MESQVMTTYDLRYHHDPMHVTAVDERIAAETATHEQAQRESIRQEILAEHAQAANADLEAEITNRINQGQGVFMAAGVHSLTEGSTEVSNVK
jgi:bisphosphoglycerate-dependent phosphoglycerate mutase